jgi:hypothetical protein
MIDIAFRVAMKSIEEKSTFEGISIPNIENEEKAYLKAIELIKEKKIKDPNKLFSFLDHVGIEKRKFEKFLMDSFQDAENNINRALNIAYYFSNINPGKGISLIPKSWIKRNIEDDTVRKNIGQNWWHLFREKNWIEKNKITD